MINFEDCTNENKTEHNPKWPYIADHSYIMLILGGSASEKNALKILINNQPDMDRIYLYTKILMQQYINIYLKNMKKQY